ncbi:MAG: dihydroorotase [Gammaproteobacteria bacterium]
MTRLTIIRPDDWHCHVRSGAILKSVMPHTARRFARAIIMPNLKPPIATVEQAMAYRSEIIDAAPPQYNFAPLMTLYLTDATTADEVERAADAEHVYAFKLYPAGATTNSDAGITDLKGIYPVLESLEKFDIPLLIHGEVTDADCDIFDRERIFIERSLSGLVAAFPGLRIVLEHVTTSEAVDFVESSSERIAATITPQHLLYNRNALLAGGIRPHHYCLPILKRERHRKALVTAATSGNPKFFLGTDSAPHPTHAKETACGCAGCYSAHAAIEMYAEAFELAGALDRLEAFASFHGPDFYRLPRNTDTITLSKTAWTVPERYGDGQNTITPLKAGERLTWQIQD